MNKQRPRGSNLPEDLIPQILLRLPVRSLLRFKTVCKSWLSLISDPQFGKSHFDLAASPSHRYQVRTIDDSVISFQDIDESFHDASAVVKLKCPLPFSPDQNIAGTYPDDDIFNDPECLCSCRGFILLIYDLGNNIIWNPATGVHTRIPGKDNLNQVTFDYLTGFGYDKLTDDYLLVLISPMDWDPFFPDEVEDFRESDYYIECFSLRTNSWSRVAGVNVRYADIDYDSRIGSLLNEALHWLVISFDTKLQVIIAFDLVERSLSEIPISHDLATTLNHRQYYLRVMGEYLSLCYPGNMNSMAEIWMMKNYKVQSSWSKVFAFSTCNIPRNVFFPICMTTYGEIFGSNASGRFMILNDKGWLVDMYTSCPTPCIDPYIQADCGVYRESLLSLPNDFEKASEDDQLTSAAEEASEDDQE
ncbi:F-box/kelch-repeat protein At3g06240-like [Lotus japonicus]|uniref:F-box/kelch-repeat protein At3g06240-like n=1 Tax=Lotus japonicus TaxID=34305 RepID=UPI00258AE974|nr:F-box/kelch-repeat protein At3g06240-like [Lotus japonicus]XP_057436180.1 F-box/kelch-repeat protein At3g06240-like [Lotus japonicus]